MVGRTAGGIWLTWALLGCGGAATNAPAAKPASAVAPAAPSSGSAAESAPAAPVAPPAATADKKLSRARVRGIHGTLNHDDIIQTMVERQQELFGCIEKGRRRVRWVSGDIEFAFKVDGDGKPADVRIKRSDLGHRELELCLLDVLAQTPFPRPAGRTLTRDFSWSMMVDPAYREPDSMDPAQLDRLLEKKAKDVYKECELKRRKNRFHVTAYVNRRGRVISLSAIPTRGKPGEQIECVQKQIKKWKIPKPRRRSKVAFELR